MKKDYKKIIDCEILNLQKKLSQNHSELTDISELIKEEKIRNRIKVLQSTKNLLEKTKPQIIYSILKDLEVL